MREITIFPYFTFVSENENEGICDIQLSIVLR
jgi:hypothetical protein